MRINHNLLANGASSQIKKNSSSISKNAEKLASGLRINRASDDSAGLAISEKMRGQIRALEQASRNTQDGISLVQTADGGYQGITEIIQRQKELIIQGSTGTYSDSDKQMIDLEIQNLTMQIDSIADRTTFNSISILKHDNYRVVDDRSSTTTTTTTSNPPLTTTTSTQIELHPIGTPDEPRHLVSTDDTTETENINTNSGSITEIVLPNGEKRYNDYNINEDKTTVTNTHTEIYESLSVSNDPKYSALTHWYTVNDNKTSFGPDHYHNLYGRMNENIEVNGSSRAVEYGSRTNSGANPAVEHFRFTGTDLSVTRSRTLMPDNSVEVKYEIINSGAANSNVKLSNLLDPPTNAVVSDSNGNPLGVGRNAIVPVSGSLFNIAGDVANAAVEFNDALAFTAPTGLTIDVPASGQPQIHFDWDLNLSAGQSVTIGFKYGSFSLNVGVYERSTDTEISKNIETTTITDIRDIDYEQPDINIQVGDNEKDVIKIPVFNVTVEGLRLTNIGVLPPASPKQSLTKLDDALTKVSGFRAIHGAYQNRLEHTMNNVNNYTENLAASESRIRDTDIAKEMVEFSKNNILLQSSQAILAQANSLPQGVLTLLR